MLRLDDIGAGTVASNPDTIVVAERLDVTLARGSDAPAAAEPGTVAVLLTNRGNGEESFELGAADDRGMPRTRFAIDRDEDGVYRADRDTLLAAPRTPPLAPGAALRLLSLGDGDASPPAGRIVTVTARAVTGSGTPGTVFAGQGDGGGDAVVGATGAQAQLQVPIAGGDTQPGFVKTQTVRAPDGSSRAVRGAVITYSLIARFAGAVERAGIVDPIPAGTAYVPGSLRLDAETLTDRADGDAGQADAAAVSVVLGDMPAAAVRTVQFQVRVQ